MHNFTACIIGSFLETALRAIQIFDLTDENQKQEFLGLITNFLDKFFGADTRSRMETRGNFKDLISQIAEIENGKLSNFLQAVFDTNTGAPVEVRRSRARGSLLNKIIGLLPSNILEFIGKTAEGRDYRNCSV